MPYNLNSATEDCYPNTTVLINKLNIQDEKTLEDFETYIFLLKATILEKTEISSNFDFNHYKSINKFLFEDLYEWAGEIRTINLSKKGTIFCQVDKIEDCAERIFERLKEMNYFKELPYDEYINEIVDFYCSTNNLHPFREGNGRTQRVFLTQLVKYAGHTINFSKTDPDLFMIATIQSANGITDLLTKLFTEIID